VQITQSDIARFWAKVDKTTPNGCWEWTAAVLTNGGYGAFRLNGQTIRAHRISYFLMKGDLIPGLEILHRCNNTTCCNPDHLTQDTHSANLKQAGAEGKMGRWFGINAKIKFSDETIRDILVSPLSNYALGKTYKVDHKTIARLRQDFQLCQPLPPVFQSSSQDLISCFAELQDRVKPTQSAP